MKTYRLLIILLVGILAVVIAAFVLTISGGEHDEPAEPAPPGSTATASGPAPTSSATVTLPPSVDVFGNRLENTASRAGTVLAQDPAGRPAPESPGHLSSAPARMQWQRGWGGAALPASGSDGPERIRDGIAEGFARTPQGAGLAAVDALARAVAAPDGVWQQVVAERYYGDTATAIDRLARSRAQTPDAGRYVTVPDGIRVMPGYRDDFAVVQIATRAEDGYTVAMWPMAWIDGDWRVRIDDPEMLWGPANVVNSLDGFGIWKAGA